MSYDEKFSDVVLLLSMQDAIADLSGSTKTVSVYGSASLSMGVAGPFGGSSLLLDGSSGYLDIASSDFNFGTGKFCIETWDYCQDQTTNYPSIISTTGGWAGGGFGLRFDNVGYAQKFTVHWNTVDDYFLVQASQVSFNQWRYIKYYRDGTLFVLQVDGSTVATKTAPATTTFNLNYGNSMRIGRSTWDGGAGYCKGNLGPIRITKNQTRADEGVPTAPFPTRGPRCILSGIAKFTDGSIATKAAAFLSGTKVLAGEATPDLITGEFSIIVPNQLSANFDVAIYRDGYRPLIHGPIAAVAS